MAKKTKFYVVWNGLKPGIYDSWNECKKQIDGFQGAKYKSYKTLAAAKEAYENGPEASIFNTGPRTKADYLLFLDEIKTPSWSVDAACSGNPGIVEYQGVETISKKVIFKMGPFKKGTNNIGEFLALIHALALLEKHGIKDLPVYSDSRTAMSWFRKKKVKTTFFIKHKNPELRELLDRATHWMLNNKVSTPVLKWNTERWGEIPADFGRK
jgi:ribonuclease HI